MTDRDLIAKFLAERGATQVAAAPAYGVDAEADKASRAKERERRLALDAEHYAEREAELVREANHTGGRRAALDELNRVRRIRLNRY